MSYHRDSELRITEILEQHFWIEHLEQCSCGETDGKRPWEYGARDYCAHVARVLVTELGLTEELSRSAFPEDAGKRRRYVTPWEPCARAVGAELTIQEDA